MRKTLSEQFPDTGTTREQSYMTDPEQHAYDLLVEAERQERLTITTAIQVDEWQRARNERHGHDHRVRKTLRVNKEELAAIDTELAAMVQRAQHAKATNKVAKIFQDAMRVPAEDCPAALRNFL